MLLLLLLLELLSLTHETFLRFHGHENTLKSSEFWIFLWLDAAFLQLAELLCTLATNAVVVHMNEKCKLGYGGWIIRNCVVLTAYTFCNSTWVIPGGICPPFGGATEGVGIVVMTATPGVRAELFTCAVK